MSFNSLCDEKYTHNHLNSPLLQNEVKTIHGIARKTPEFDTVLPKHMKTPLSVDIAICPMVVSFISPGTTVRIPERECNMSTRVIQIPRNLITILFE